MIDSVLMCMIHAPGPCCLAQQLPMSSDTLPAPSSYRVPGCLLVWMQELEGELSAADTTVGQLQADKAHLEATYDRAVEDAHAARNDAYHWQQQFHQSQKDKAGLETTLQQWKDSYYQLDGDNKLMREMLGPKAPAPHALSAPAAAAPAAVPPAVPAPAPAAAVAGGKPPPPGFPSVPGQRQGMPPAAAGSAAHGAQPPTPVSGDQPLRNEHGLVRLLLTLLPEDLNAAVRWDEGMEMQVDAQLAPQSWATHYQRVYGSILTFMRQRPAVFAEVTGGPAIMFFKFPGAEQKVTEAEEAERVAQAEAAAAAAAAAVSWHMQGQQQPAFAGLQPDSSSSFMPEPHHQQQQQQGGWGGHASMPMMPPAGALVAPGLSVPFMAPHQGLMLGAHGMAGAPTMSMPMAPPSMPVGHGHHHQGMHSHNAGGW